MLGGKGLGSRAKRKNWSSLEIRNCPVAGVHVHLGALRHCLGKLDSTWFIPVGILRMPGKEMMLFLAHHPSLGVFIALNTQLNSEV